MLESSSITKQLIKAVNNLSHADCRDSSFLTFFHDEFNFCFIIVSIYTYQPAQKVEKDFFMNPQTFSGFHNRLQINFYSSYDN